MLIKNKLELISIAKSITTELFSLSLILYLLLFIIEEVKEGTISYYLDINYVLIATVVFGVFMVLFKEDKND